MKGNWQPQVNQAERDWLIEKHKPIVFHLAKKIASSLPFQTDMEELIAYGQLGLIEASERFDQTRGNSFSTFAFYRVRGAIYDGLREMGVIKRSHAANFSAHANEFLNTEFEDAASGVMNVDEEIETVESLIDSLLPIYFLSLDEEDAAEVKDEAAFNSADFEKRDLLGRIRRVIDELDNEDAELLRNIYFKNIMMKDLAVKLGVTKSWISRLHARAIRHLQEALRKEGILRSD